MAYPTSADLESYLSGCGVTLTGAQSALLENEITAAIELYESLVGRKMEAESVSQTYLFNPPDNNEGKIYFGMDFATITSVGYQPICAGSGSTLQANVDYTLFPRNAVAKGKPYRYMQLGGSGSITSPVYIGYRGSYRVAGKHGYALEIPQLAFNGILKLATIKMVAPISFGGGGSVKRKRIEDYEVEYGNGQYSGEITSWMNDIQLGINNFKIWF